MASYNSDLLQESWGEYYIPSVGPGYVTVRRGGPFDNSAPQVRLQIPNEQQTLARVKEVVANTDMDAAFSSGGGGSGGGGGGGGSSGGGGGGSSGSPDVRILDFGLSPGFPDQREPLAAGETITFEITVENQGNERKPSQRFTVTANGQQVFNGSLATSIGQSTKRNVRFTIPEVGSEGPVDFCARLSDKDESQCASLTVTPGFDNDAVQVSSIDVPGQITLGEDLSGSFRVDNGNPQEAEIRWRVDFNGVVVDDNVARVPGGSVVEIQYAGRAPETTGSFDVCARLDSVTPR